ncbi:MAG: ArnT family glycosyltransferase [Candidatus Kapaibacteriota bacterium]
MPESKEERKISLKFFQSLIIIFVAIVLGVTFIVMLLRIQYPYQLEWMEGGEIEHIIRLLEGKSIYCEPNIDFIPYIYTPLFYYLGLGFAFLFSPSFFSIRLISLLSFLISLWYIYQIVRISTNDKFWGIVAIGIYSLSFSTTGFWFDLARVDILANLFLIASFYYMLKGKEKDIVLSAILSFFAFYTKQTNLLVTLFLCIPLFLGNRKLALRFSFVYLLLVLISTIVETIVSNGWYLFWNFYFPSTHHWIWSRAVTFWTIDILPFYSIALAIIIALILIDLEQSFKPKLSYFIFLFIGTMVSSYFSRLHYGGYLNVLIPFVFSISVFFPFALNELGKKEFLSRKVRFVLFVFVFFQFALLMYDPIYPIPKESDKKEIEQVLNFAKSFDGEVYLMGYNFAQSRLGLPSRPHYVLVNDLLISNVPQKQKFLEEFENALKRKKFKAIVLDDDLKLDMLEKYYKKTTIVFYHRVFNSKSSGYRKEVVWIPKQ